MKRTILVSLTLAAAAISGGAAVHAKDHPPVLPAPLPSHAGEASTEGFSYVPGACTKRQMERARDLVVNGGTVAHRPTEDACLSRVAMRRAINKLDGAAEPFYRSFNDDAFIGAESFDRECVYAVFWNHENRWLKPLKSYWVEGGRCPE
jgi:hypothetical protein